MIKGKKVSTEIGTMSLLFVSLFFISQIMGAEAFYQAIFEPGEAAAATSTTSTTVSGSSTTTTTVTNVNGTVTSNTTTDTTGETTIPTLPNISIPTITNPGTPAVSPTPSAAVLRIELQNEIVNVQRGDKDVVLQELELKNELNRTAAIEITGFTVKSSNAGATIATVNFDGVYLYQDGKLIATGVSSNNSISFDKAYVNVPAGGSSVVALRGDIGSGAASGSLTFSLRLDATPGTGGVVEFTPTVVTGRSATVNILKVVQDVSLLATVMDNEVTSTEKGALGAQLIAAKLANTGKEDLTVSALKSNGTFSSACVSNVALYVDGVKSPATAALTSGAAVLSGLALNIPVAGSVTIALKGDVAEKCGKSSLIYSLPEDGITAQGATSGTQATVSVAGARATLGLFTKNNDNIFIHYPAKALTAQLGDKKALLQEIKLTGAKNEDVTLSGMVLHANVMAGSNAKDATGILDKVYLYEGDKLIGTATLNADKDYAFAESYTLLQGKTVTLSVRGDIAAQTQARSIRVAFPDNGKGYTAQGATSAKAVTVRQLGSAAHLMIIDPADCRVTTEADSTVTECVATEETTETSTTVSEIKDGSLIRLKDGIDVYIVKIADGKSYKRLILSPTVFKSYKHLKWDDIIEVDQATLDSFTTSALVRVAGSDTVWQLQPNADRGIRHRVTARNYEASGVYEINRADEAAYEQGADING